MFEKEYFSFFFEKLSIYLSPFFSRGLNLGRAVLVFSRALNYFNRSQNFSSEKNNKTQRVQWAEVRKELNQYRWYTRKTQTRQQQQGVVVPYGAKSPSYSMVWTSRITACTTPVSWRKGATPTFVHITSSRANRNTTHQSELLRNVLKLNNPQTELLFGNTTWNEAIQPTDLYNRTKNKNKNKNDT